MELEKLSKEHTHCSNNMQPMLKYILIVAMINTMVYGGI